MVKIYLKKTDIGVSSCNRRLLKLRPVDNYVRYITADTKNFPKLTANNIETQSDIYVPCGWVDAYASGVHWCRKIVDHDHKHVKVANEFLKYLLKQCSLATIGCPFLLHSI